MIVYITTDGSGTSKGAGGWAAVLRCGDSYKEISGAVAEATNNSMEITAAIMALRELNRPCVCEITTDSEYLRDSAKYRIANWVKYGWKTQDGEPVKNKDLWLELQAEVEKHTKITWFWTKGHSGHPDNERCDVLAGAARATLVPPKDPNVKKSPPKKVRDVMDCLREALDVLGDSWGGKDRAVKALKAFGE